MMIETLAGLTVTVYIDDILIATETEEEHLKLLDETLDRIAKSRFETQLKENGNRFLMI